MGTLEAAREGDIFTGRPLTVEGKYRYFLILTGKKLDSSCAGVNDGETDSTDIRITVNGVKMDTHPSINKEALESLEDVFMKANMEDKLKDTIESMINDVLGQVLRTSKERVRGINAREEKL